MPELPSGTITFLFTDIEGSTQLWERYPEAMKAALARHDATLRRAIESHGGHVFKTVGDAFCAAFHVATDALAAALDAQRRLNAESWGEAPISVRVALHTGAAEERGGDYFGPTVNRVARLMSAGHGGQVLLSQYTQELVRDGLPAATQLRDMGECRLKDLIRSERIFQLVAPGLPADFLPLKTLDVHRHNLPVQLTSFIGRAREMAEVRQRIANHRLVTLTGPGGTGKTRLSLQVGAELMETFPDGVWLAELAPVVDPALVSQTLVTLFGLREERDRSALTLVADFLREKRALLILDNCEHLIDACAQVADGLLRACPNLKMLTSSREALGITGEVAFRVPSLSLPDTRQPPLIESLSRCEAVRLFVERAAAVLSGFALTSDNAAAIAQVCCRLDGIPLAIELAAARVKVLRVDQIAARLNDAFRFLTGGSRTALPRQQTLRATIDWSYNLLSDAEQVLLRRSAVFVGGWTLDAAESVCSGDGIDASDMLDLLTGLTNKSMVIADREMGAETRYRPLETVRQYAREKLVDAEETETLRARHLDFFLKWAEQAELELQGVNQVEWLDQLEVEHDNLRAALEWSLENQAGLGGRLGSALWRFWLIRGNVSEGRQWLEAALQKGQGSNALRVKALHRAGVLAFAQGDYDRASILAEEAVSLARESEDKENFAFSLALKADVLRIRGDLKQAEALCQQSRRAFRALGYQWGVASATAGLSTIATVQDDMKRAAAWAEEGLALFRESGDKWSIAELLGLLQGMARAQGDYERALALSEECLSLYRELSSKWGVAMALNWLGWASREQGQFERATEVYDESLSLYRELGNKRGTCRVLLGMGIVAWRQGDYARAKTLLEESLALRREMNDKQMIAYALLSLGDVALSESETTRAAAQYSEGLTLLREFNWDRSGITEALRRLAAVEVAWARSHRAAKLFGAAEAIRQATALPLPPLDRADYHRDMAAARAQLDEAAFAAAWSEGRAMTPEQAIAYALEQADG